MVHDILSPSAAAIWCNCPGAMALASTLPEQDTDTAYTLEGTAAHAEAERAALAAFSFGEYEPTTNDTDMAGHARAWASCLRRYVRPNATAFWAAERQFNIGCVTRRDAVGTADFVAIDTDGVLTIADFKYGMGVDVPVEKNLQLSIYALAAIDELNSIFDIKRVRLLIFQPRICAAEKVYEWELDDLAEFGRHITAAAELAASFLADTDNAKTALRPGDAQCRFCRAKAICPALQARVRDLTAADFSVIPAPKQSIPVPTEPEQLARALPWLNAIESWCDAVRSTALNLAEHGTEIPGYKVVEGRKGARRWLPDAEERLRGMRVSRAVIYEKTLISPTKAEKAFKAGSIGPRQWKALSELITQPDGKPVLAPNSDKRDAIKITRDEFQVLN